LCWTNILVKSFKNACLLLPWECSIGLPQGHGLFRKVEYF